VMCQAFLQTSAIGSDIHVCRENCTMEWMKGPVGPGYNVPYPQFRSETSYSLDGRILGNMRKRDDPIHARLSSNIKCSDEIDI